MAWYDSAIFYHIYPLGLCGCCHENNGQSEQHFDILTKWAKHASKIGCNAIYIGPLFESGSHGYDTIDYRMVDRRIGGNDDFKAWVKMCHEMDVKVIVDGVFNHVGREFFAFKDLRENKDGSRYKDWFCNVNFWNNNEYNDGFSYDNWGGYNLLVKLNQRNPEVYNYLFDTVKFWIDEFDVDGIRLDAADVLDFDFMKMLRERCDSWKSEFWLMGEVIHGDYSRWANEQTLHSVTNYELHKGLFSGHNDHNYFEIAHSVKRLLGICGRQRLYLFVDNHDVARIASKVNNKEHVKNIMILLYTLYGIPSLYYGSEFAIEANKEKGSDWNLRPALELDDYKDAYQNNPVTKLCMELAKMKANCAELTYGEYRELTLTTGHFAYARVLDDAATVSYLNNTDQEVWLEAQLPFAGDVTEHIRTVDMPDNEALLAKKLDDCELYDGTRLKVKLPPNSGRVFRVVKK